MLWGTDNTMQNIPSFNLNVRNIPYNIVNPIEHCYEFEYCYKNNFFHDKPTSWGSRVLLDDHPKMLGKPNA